MVHEVFAILTCPANALVRPIHARAMPVIPTTGEEIEQWLTEPLELASRLQRSLPGDMLEIVARGEKEDGAGSMAAVG